MIKVNTYFDGNVKSLGFERENEAFTAGVVLPGAYTFDTQSHFHAEWNKMDRCFATCLLVY